MKLAYVFVVAMAAMLTAPAVQAQTDSAVYSRFRVLLTNGKRVEGRSGAVRNDSLIGKSAKGAPLSIPTNEIRAMDRYAGNKAVTGAIIGAGVGLLTGLTAYLSAEAQAESDPYLEVNESAVAPVIIGCTAAGALVGMFVGMSMQSWEKVPVAKPQVVISHDGGKIVFTLAF